MTTIVSMLKESKQSGREIKGAIAKIVPDNKKFELISYDIEGNKFTFQEIVDENEEKLPEVIVISDDNAMVAHLDHNPNPKPDYEADIFEGPNGHKVLKVSEKEIDMGTIKGLKVLCGLKGKVVFSVETEKEEVVDIWSYDVQYDRFDLVSTDFGSNIKRIQLGDEVYLLDNIVSMVEIKDKDGFTLIEKDGTIVKKPLLESASLYRVNVSNAGKDSIVYIQDASYDQYIEDEENNEELGDLFKVPIDDVRVISQGMRKDIVILTSKKVDEEGYLEDDDKYTLHLFIYDGMIGNSVGRFYVKDSEAKVYLGGPASKPPVVTVKDRDKILIRDKNGLHVVDDSEIVKELEGFNYYCGCDSKNNDKDQQVVTYYYTNGERSLVKSFNQTFTDRGILFSISQ